MRMLEIDKNLNFGNYDIRVNNMYTNAIEIIWDGKNSTSIFIKCNCTSTALLVICFFFYINSNKIIF